jgi:hypothetical protein
MAASVLHGRSVISIAGTHSRRMSPKVHSVLAPAETRTASDRSFDQSDGKQTGELSMAVQ